MTEKELKEVGINDENLNIIRTLKDGSLLVLPSDDNDYISLLIKDTKESLELIEAQPHISFGINQYIVSTGKEQASIVLIGFKINDYKCFSVFFGSQKNEIELLKKFLNSKDVTFIFNSLNENQEVEARFLNLNKEETTLTFELLENFENSVETLETIAAVLTFAFAKESIVDLIFDENFPTNTVLDFTPFIKQNNSSNEDSNGRN